MRRAQASFEAQPRAVRLLAPKMGIGPYGAHPKPRAHFPETSVNFLPVCPCAEGTFGV